MLQIAASIRLLAQVTEEPHVEEPGGIELLLPHTSELIAGLIAFGIIFVFVWKWVLPKVDQRLAARQEAITGQLRAAEASKQEAQTLLDDYRKQLSGARDEANRIVDEARRTADGVQADTVAKANAEAADIVRKARDEAVAEKDRAAAAIRAEVASLSLAVAEKAVAGAIDAKTQQKLVDQYIAELGGLRS